MEERVMIAISNSASPEIIWGLGGLEEDHQLHHCCWTGHVGKREEEEQQGRTTNSKSVLPSQGVNVKRF